ncbi:MAG: DUF4360 domain-containing protein [Leucothrix sp.]
MNLRFALVICCLLTPTVAKTMQPNVKLLNVKYAGNGCPSGSVSVTMTPSKGAINSVFDDFFASFSGKPNQQVRRCKLSMKVQIPKNKRARLRQIYFKGFVELPQNASARIVRNYRFDNRKKQLLSNVQGQTFKILNAREAFNTPWSKCGKDIELEIDSMIELKSRSKQSAQLGIDSFNHLVSRNYRGERGWKFMLHYAPC